MTTRAGRTEKISISLDKQDAALLRRRAKALHDGNVSRVVADALRYLRYEEGRDALIESFGDVGMVTAEEVAAIASEWRAPPRGRTKKRGKRAA